MSVYSVQIYLLCSVKNDFQNIDAYGGSYCFASFSYWYNLYIPLPGGFTLQMASNALKVALP